ncbi:MAG: rRNA pseudouridine synthase [Dethiobacter sp.]|jgi:23S rRNA pseudouridine2605 synthase/16S rRNA pseudouridine516 synthase|nr:MAG: rRNA pseudouridine synthase [Dethiobacter sp.]
MRELIRLPKFLASGGVASRRAAEKLIAAGRVKVNGIPVREPGRKIDPQCDRVEVDDIPVETAGEKKYYLLFKPKGYLTTVRDPFGRPTVMDLFPEGAKDGLFPVGRLDMDTEGLLLMTNDGELAFRLMHPRFQIEKKYLATVKGVPSAEDLLQFHRGILLEEGRTAPAKVKVCSQGKRNTQLLITIHEGKKRQVKRMCQALEHPVISLKRVSLAFLNLKGLNPSAFRPLTREEIRKLSVMVGLKDRL